MYIILLPSPYFVQSILFILHTTPSAVTLVADAENDVAIRPLEDVILGNLPVWLLGANIVNVSGDVVSFIGIR